MWQAPRKVENGLQVVLKVASRCNLNCTYCYVYNKGDDSWRHRPALMPEEVFRTAIERTRRHCQVSGQSSVSLTFHGGEPCLVGVKRFEKWCAFARSRLQDLVAVQLCLQTNATMLDEAWAEALARHDVKVGISIDGTQPEHDRFRVDHQGRGTYERVARGIDQIRAVGIPLQLLSVIQFGTDGVRIHRHFVGLGARIINYLLPDFTHETVDVVRREYGETPCADFLLPIFDEWWYRGTMDVQVSLFWNIARSILGGESDVDLLGNRPLRFIFVETDGQIEALDVLRSSVPGISNTGLHVSTHDFQDAAAVSSLHRKVIFDGMPLPTACRSCVERETCGGGYLPHRYSKERKFDNPSIWCADLLRLFGHIRERLKVSPEQTKARHQILHEQLLSPALEAGSLSLMPASPETGGP